MPDIAALFRIEVWAVVLLVVIAVIFLAFIVNRGIKVHRHRVAAGREDLLGKTATVRTPLSPQGTVFLKGERWTAICKDGPVQVGEDVTVTGVDNLVLSVVRKTVKEANG